MDASPSLSSSSRYRHTCIPSVVPPGVDPTSVDFRTFFPYIPNEVKHRKRTSRSQLKVLEDVYRKDTKPNASCPQETRSLSSICSLVQCRRAKDKQLRKRAAQHLQADEQDTTATAPHDEPQPEPPFDLTEESSEHTQERVSPRVSSADLLPFMSDSSISPTGLQQGPPATPVDASHSLDSDLYSTRRGSLPTVMPVQDPPFPSHFIDRRKSLDVNCHRLMQHPYAGLAREKNEALLAKSPLSPPGSTQALTRQPAAVGPIRSPPLPSYPYSSRTHRASEPHVFTPLRGATYLTIPDSSPISTTSPSVPPHLHPRRSYENRAFAFASRHGVPSIPGPLPRPDFQFGESSSASPPQNASPEGDTPPSSSSGSSAQAPSPDISLSMLHRWSFPRGSTTSITSATSANGGPPHCGLREGDGDAEDAISTTPSSSMGCLSRFGSVASINGSESSAMFSDVSSCVAVDMGGDPGVRRGSYVGTEICKSGTGQLLEMRMSGLKMNNHQSLGDLGTHPPSGYASSSTLSPGDRHPIKETGSTSCPPLSRSGSMYEFGGVPPNEIPLVRRGSMPPTIHVIPEQHMHARSHDHSMYMQNTGTEAKYSIQWASGSGDYVTQSHQHFPPQDTHSFAPDTPANGSANGAYPQAHQYPILHQPRQHTHALTDPSYPPGYHLRESVMSSDSAMAAHGIAASGYAVGVPVPPHSGSSLGDYTGNAMYRGQEAWGL
ncbi:hypothetical protein F5141DRAFT_1061173 [Pisolithus sp. B1]|nr:hypothetical protein F5141DRAFT_1061173 [Pisolithus sp. B1]